MSSAATAAKSQAKTHPLVLVVDDEPGLVELVSDLVGSMDCRTCTAASLAEAEHLLATQPIQLLVTDVHLPDGDGLTLLDAMHRLQPRAGAIVMTGMPTVDRAITAMRGGAVDFLAKPFGSDQLVERVRLALDRQARLTKADRKVERLRVAVKRLNEARKVIGRKVDLLCNDLVSAYGELSRQLESVRTQEAFRKCIADSRDLEQMLCHAMDWMLRQLGYCNVAVWLAGDDGDYQLGAYMKYTVPGEQILTAALKRELLPLVARDNFLRINGDELRDRMTPQEHSLLRGQEILGVNCSYLGECLAGMMFFRDVRKPFTAEDESLLKAISPIFAISLAGIVRDTPAPGEEDEPTPGGDSALDDEKPQRRSKKDAADWWKRGEQPPF